MFTEPTGLMFLNEHFRLVTFTYTMGTLYQFFMRHFSAGDRFDAVLRRPDHFQQVLISSPACALIRLRITILISMPIGHRVCTIFGVWQVSVGYCFFIRRRIGSGFLRCLEPYFPAASIRLHHQ